MSRPVTRKDTWSAQQRAWLQVVWERGYPRDEIVEACGRTLLAVKGMVQKCRFHRPKGYSGKAMAMFHANLAPIPPFPGRRVVRRPRAEDSRRQEDTLKPPPVWQRRCQACPTIFLTEKVEDVFCPNCLAAFGKTQAREAAKLAPEHSDVKTSSWFADQ